MVQRVVIYSRVSTKHQDTKNQVQLLREIVVRNGWDLVDEYEDRGVSGSKGRDQRPEFDRLAKDMVRRKFDKILVWDVSRLGRSLQHLVDFLNDVNHTGVDLYIHQSGLDTSTPSGKMMFQMIGVFSEFEREMISERIKLGLEKAKSKGVRLGRKRTITDEMIHEMKQMRGSGSSLGEISQVFGVSRVSVMRKTKPELEGTLD